MMWRRWTTENNLIVIVDLHHNGCHKSFVNHQFRHRRPSTCIMVVTFQLHCLNLPHVSRRSTCIMVATSAVTSTCHTSAADRLASWLPHFSYLNLPYISRRSTCIMVATFQLPQLATSRSSTYNFYLSSTCITVAKFQLQQLATSCSLVENGKGGLRSSWLNLPVASTCWLSQLATNE